MSTRAKPPGRPSEPTVPHDDGFREFAESIVQHIDEVFFWTRSLQSEAVFCQPCLREDLGPILSERL